MKIGKYEFAGPFSNAGSLLPQSGVYVILGRSGDTNTSGAWSVIDIGESHDIQFRVNNHDRRNCWLRTGYQELAVAALYESEQVRGVIELELRRIYNPPCGNR